MGGGKRNYNSMRRRHVQWRKKDAPIEAEPRKTPPKEDVDRLIALLEKKRKENENKT